MMDLDGIHQEAPLSPSLIRKPSAPNYHQGEDLWKLTDMRKYMESKLEHSEMKNG
jgi:hypothetical protein